MVLGHYIDDESVTHQLVQEIEFWRRAGRTFIIGRRHAMSVLAHLAQATEQAWPPSSYAATGLM